MQSPSATHARGVKYVVAVQEFILVEGHKALMMADLSMREGSFHLVDGTRRPSLRTLTRGDQHQSECNRTEQPHLLSGGQDRTSVALCEVCILLEAENAPQ